MINNVDIVQCGCSFSAKIIDIDFPYGELLSNKLNRSFINLSTHGASNYFITKQIEYSLKFNPKLVLIGVTTPMRFETSIDTIDRPPTIEDFKYTIDYEWNSKINKKIISKPLLWYEKSNPKISNFYLENYNSNIKKDQDRLMLLGGISLLKINNIKFIVIDFSNIFENTLITFDLIYEDFRSLSEKYPHPDSLHFNQAGHEYISSKIFNILKDNETI